MEEMFGIVALFLYINVHDLLKNSILVLDCFHRIMYPEYFTLPLHPNKNRDIPPQNMNVQNIGVGLEGARGAIRLRQSQI